MEQEKCWSFTKSRERFRGQSWRGQLFREIQVVGLERSSVYDTICLRMFVGYRLWYWDTQQIKCYKPSKCHLSDNIYGLSFSWIVIRDTRTSSALKQYMKLLPSFRLFINFGYKETFEFICTASHGSKILNNMML